MIKKRAKSKKDINQYKSLSEIDKALNNDIQLSHRQEVRKNQKARRNADIESEASLVFSGDGFDVWVPETYAASCKLGQGASWCTASTESDYYYDYYKDTFGGDYYILINQNDPEDKYQFHFESLQFMTKKNTSISLKEFLSTKPNLNTFFKQEVFKKLGVENPNDKVSFPADEVLEYIPEQHRDERLNGDQIMDILFGEQQCLFDWFYDSYYHVSLDDLSYYLPESINESNKKILENEGIDCSNRFSSFIENLDGKDDIKDAILRAGDTAEAAGAANECYEDVVSVFTTNGLITDFENNLIALSAENMYNIFCNGEGDVDTYDCYSFKDIMKAAIASLIIVREPYSGWYGFDKETFNEELSIWLSDLGIHEDEI